MNEPMPLGKVVAIFLCAGPSRHPHYVWDFHQLDRMHECRISACAKPLQQVWPAPKKETR